MPKDVTDASLDKVEITTRDGATLAGHLFLPAHDPSAVVVLCGATAVPQGYYRHFARWLAKDRGYACLTFDYRDMGLSAEKHVRRSTATMADWGVTDCEAARMYLAERFPHHPLWHIGHSLGAMTIALQRHTEQIDRVIGVASGQVHHKDHPWPYRALALSFWFGFGPVLTTMLGFFPGRALGLGEDIPASAYWQWRKWCTSEGCHRDEVGQTLPPWRAENLPDDIHYIAFSDDDLCPEASVRRQARAYNHAAVDVIDPADHDLEKVGHLSVFSKRNAALWPSLIAETVPKAKR